MGEVAQLMGRRRFSDALSRLRAGIAAWERQVRLEEEVLYPLFELRLGTVAGTAAMRGEHSDLRNAFAALAEALEGARYGASREAHAHLVASLDSHFSREERIVYPTLDAMLSDRERGRLLARVDSQAPAAGEP